jgi:hypothetical protein
MLINPVPFGTDYSRKEQATYNLPRGDNSRTCTRCLRQLPQTTFRVIQSATGRRARHCNTCHALAERHRRNKSHRADKNRRLYHAWGFLARATDRRRSIERLCLALLAEFGSEQNLALAWREAFQEASASRRLRALAAMIELLRWTEANPESFRQLTDKELAAEFARELAS